MIINNIKSQLNIMITDDSLLDFLSKLNGESKEVNQTILDNISAGNINRMVFSIKYLIYQKVAELVNKNIVNRKSDAELIFAALYLLNRKK